jgi:hypothetical protein
MHNVPVDPDPVPDPVPDGAFESCTFDCGQLDAFTPPPDSPMKHPGSFLIHWRPKHPASYHRDADRNG